MQLYIVTVTVNLRNATEKTTIAVTASNADAAKNAACVHCQVSPSMASVIVKRIKGNCYVIAQSTRENRQQVDVVPSRCARRDVGDERPPIFKRRIEIRATIHSRTDSAAYVGVGRAVEAFGRRGVWETDFVDVEDISCVDIDNEKPSNGVRFEQNANYSSRRIFRG